MTDTTAHTDTRSQNQRQPGVSLFAPGTRQTSVDAAPLTRVGPRRSEEQHRLLDALLPACVRVVRDLQDRPFGVDDGRDRRRFADEILREESEIRAPSEAADDVALEVHEFVDDVVEWASGWSDVSDAERLTRDQQRTHARLNRSLTRVGTGRGAWNAGVEAVRHTFVELLSRAERVPSLSLRLDGPEWCDLGDARTGRAMLDLLDLLGEAVDIDVSVSPDCFETLRRRYPEWTNEHLTQGRDSSRRRAPPATDEQAHPRAVDARQADAYDVLSGYGGEGRRRVLKNLLADDTRTVRAVKDDPEVDLGPSTVDRYLGDLERDGLVAIERLSGSSNRVSLTVLGQASQELITASYGLLHPNETDLSTYLTGPCNKFGSTVYGPEASSGDPSPEETADGQPSLTAEEYLAATGDPEADSQFVQWLGTEGRRLNAYALHKRYLAGRHSEGVTFVDDPVEEFEDGRVSYVSCLEDELQVFTQWGWSGPTLGRLAAALSSEHVWGKVLTREALGEDLSKVHGGAFGEDLHEKLVDGDQLGWLRKEMDYDEFRDRLYKIGRSLLARIGDTRPGAAPDLKSEFYLDAHGLATTMTKLLDAVGVDVTCHIRLPDAEDLRRHDRNYPDFLEFFRHTVSKHSSYGIHSGPRNVQEERSEKLKQRLPIEIDPDDPVCDLTCSWVVSGPDADKMADDVADYLGQAQVREALAEGREDGLCIEVPVARGNSYASIKRVVEDLVGTKGWLPWQEDLRRLIRVMLGTLSNDRHNASPFDVAEALLALPRPVNGEPLTVRDIEYALGTLPAERLFPAHRSKSIGKFAKELLASDEPLSVSELVERADVCRKTWSNNNDVFLALGLFERTDDGLVANLEPWWASESSNDPVDVDLPTGDALFGASTPTEMLWEVALVEATVGDLDREALAADVWFDSPGVDAIVEAIPLLSRWAPLVTSLVDEDHVDDEADDRMRVARLGSLPPALNGSQTTLTA